MDMKGKGWAFWSVFMVGFVQRNFFHLRQKGLHVHSCRFSGLRFVDERWRDPDISVTSR